MGSGCHELGEGWKHLKTCVSLCSVLLSTPLLLPDPLPVSSVSVCSSVYTFQTQTSGSPGYSVFLKVWLLAKSQFYFHLVWKI